VTAAIEAEEDAVVDQPLTRQALPDADLAQQLDGALLQDTGAYPLLKVLLAAILQNHRFDSGAMQKLAQDQARGAGSDDPDLGLALHDQPRSGGDFPVAGAAPPEFAAVVVAAVSAVATVSAATSFSTRCAMAKAVLAAGMPA
jgi:hypothetical protein